MKQLLIILTLVTLLAPNTFAAFFWKRDKSGAQSLLARVTVYWASGGRGSDRYTRHHKCATGLRLHYGHCAVDPQRIPYGSNILFPDGTRLAAVDTGSAVRNRKAARLLGRTIEERNALVIDRFFETKQEALAWANTHPHFMTVRVIRPNTQAITVASVSSPQSTRYSKATAPSLAMASSSGGMRLPGIR